MRMALVFNKGLLRHLLIFIFGLSILSFMLFGIYAVTQHPTLKDNVGGEHLDVKKRQQTSDVIHTKQAKTLSASEVIRKSAKKEESSFFMKNHTKLNPFDHKVTSVQDKNSLTYLFKNITLNFNVHIFYYPWYKNEIIDGKYAHWNHEVIPDWHKPGMERRRQYVPPDDIGANYYPKLGPYSSHDPKVIEEHMKQMRFMGTGVVCVSWYPPQYLKNSETQVDDSMMAIFHMADKYGVKITFHIEPYENRSGKTILEVSKFIIDKYGNHPAFYRTNFKGRSLPVYYVYDSYQIPEASWAEALKQGGKYSVRNTKYDAVFLGLLVEHGHFNHLSKSGFDGFYTYFAANGFTFGSSWRKWHDIADESRHRNLIFVPSIGPGYLDTRVRPWNSKNSRLRLNGKYYRKSFYNALSVKPHFLSVTSYNEWHEGTQVEPAIPKGHQGFKYKDYQPGGPEFYLNLTQHFVGEYTRNMSAIHHIHEL